MNDDRTDLIDWNRVASLRDDVGDDDFAEVLQLFLDESAEAVDRLVSGLPAEGLERACHSLKGAARNLGFASLAELCASGERSAAAGRHPEVDLAAIAQTFAASRDVLLAGLAPPG
jgi:HPt (histidine-containing phosphotransfer) domain-containing protein